MKKTICALLTVISITFILLVHVESVQYKGMTEVCLNGCYSLEETEDALEMAQIYDYLILYDLYNGENSIAYKGNINILLGNRIKDKTSIELSENEVFMGDKFAEKNYEYYPLGSKHELYGKEYSINAIIENSDYIYYNDLSILENQNIKRQRIYVLLKDTNGTKIDENTFISILKSSNITPAFHIYYDNLRKLLLKIIILCLIVILVYAIFKLKDGLKKLTGSLRAGYRERRYDITVFEYIKERENLKVIKTIIAYSAAVIAGVLNIMFFTVKFINLRMPYSVNPLSPKSVFGLIKSFCDFIAYYLNNGFTEMSWFVLEIVVVCFAAILIAFVFYIGGKYYKMKKTH